MCFWACSNDTVAVLSTVNGCLRQVGGEVRGKRVRKKFRTLGLQGKAFTRSCPSWLYAHLEADA